MKYYQLLYTNLVVLGRRLRPVTLVLILLSISALVCASGASLVSSILTSYTSSNQNEGKSGIWRIDSRWTSSASGENGIWATSPAPIAKMIRTSYGDRFHVSSFTPVDSQLKIDDLSISFDGVFINEGPTLDVFKWDVLSGVEPDKLLPGQAIITQKAANSLFPQEEVIGKKIQLKVGGVYKNKKTFSIVSVVKDFPGNRLLQPKIVVIQNFPVSDVKAIHSGGLRGLPVEWFRPNTYTYIRRIEPVENTKSEIRELDSLISTIENNTPDLNGWKPEFLYHSLFEARSTLGIYENPLSTLPVTSLYLMGGVVFLLVVCSAISTFFFFAVVGISFKSILSSMNRIGIPEIHYFVLFGLICFFFSLIVCLLGLMFTKAFSYQFISFLNVRSSSVFLSSSGGFNLVIAVFVLLFSIGVIALHSALHSSTRILQRVFSVISLILGLWAVGISVLLYFQQEHINDKALGFNPDNVFVLAINEDNVLAPKLNVLKQKIGLIPGVKSVYAAQNIPGDTDYKYLELRLFDQLGATNRRIQAISAEPGLIKALGVPLVYGDYHAPHDNDNNYTLSQNTKQEILINRSASSLLGGNDAANIVSKRLAMFDSDDVNQSLRVTGVIEDFNFLPPIESIEPLLLYQQPRQYRKLVVFFDAAASGLGSQVLAEWNQIFPTLQPHTYYLKSRYENYGKQHTDVMKISIFGCALSLFGVFISLFGSMRFTTLCRQREISIRRIVGAKVSQLGGLYGNQYIFPVIIGLPCALLATLFAGSFWLRHFAYRVYIFDPKILSSLILAMLTTSLCGVVMSFIMEIPNFNRREYSTLTQRFNK
jgi:hypothetical protein